MQKKTLLLIIGLWAVLAVAGAAKRFTLVIDAGHGGKDSGALGAHSKEKDVALNVAKAFGRYVEQNCSDVKVIYTRKTDVFIPLQERANIANRNKADLFVSIHCNSLPGGKIARGMETYTLGMHRASDNLEVAKRENSVILIESDYKQRYAGFDPRSSESYIIFELMQDKNMEQSVKMAKLVQQKVCGTMGRPNKGVKQAGFLVLRETSMPSCLIELGFISTPDEERMLTSPTSVESMAHGIYQAFAAYKRGKSSSSNEAPVKPQAKETVAETQRPSDTVQTDTASGSVSRRDNVKKEEAKKDNTPDTGGQSAPVFKVQILTSDVKLKAGSSKLKGQTGTDFFKEGVLYKYTVGSSTDLNEMQRLLRSVRPKFPDAFIIAFRDGKKTDVAEAAREFRERSKKGKR